VGEGNQLARAVPSRDRRLGDDPKIVEALVQPVTDGRGLTAADEQLLHEIAEDDRSRHRNAHGTTAAAVADAVEALFLKLSEGASIGTVGALSDCACCTPRSSTARSRARS